MSKRKIKKLIFLLIASTFFLLFDFYYEGSKAKDYFEKFIKKVSLTVTPIATSLKKDNYYYPVLRVIDGDTVEIEIKGKKERVRLIGVNTPEVDDPRPVAACLARLAKEKTKEKLSGKLIRLESDPTQGNRDKYQRLLRYVFLEDGENFNLWLIKQGYAYEYTYQFPYRYQKEFQDQQRKAQEKKRGLWSEKIECTQNDSHRSFLFFQLLILV